MEGLINYKIYCKGCKNATTVGIINNETLMWNDNGGNIISGRKRLDGEWGWQCVYCGANDLLTEQEKTEIKDKSKPDPKDISKVIQNLVRQKPLFAMEKTR